jgi:hypothetical protein
MLPCAALRVPGAEPGKTVFHVNNLLRKIFLKNTGGDSASSPDRLSIIPFPYEMKKYNTNSWPFLSKLGEMASI